MYRRRRRKFLASRLSKTRFLKENQWKTVPNCQNFRLRRPRVSYWFRQVQNLPKFAERLGMVPILLTPLLIWSFWTCWIIQSPTPPYLVILARGCVLLDLVLAFNTYEWNINKQTLILKYCFPNILQVVFILTHTISTLKSSTFSVNPRN